MDPILLIIKYFYKTKRVENNDESIESFLENGISFPEFISLIFDNEKIPNLIINPKTVFHKKINNDLAIQFLFQHNQYIKKFNPSYENNKDNLFFLIFTKQIFHIDQNEIFKKCNSIVQTLGIHFNSKKDLMQMTNLVKILNVLTDGNVPIISDDQKNNDIEISECFSKAKIPLVVNKQSLEIQNQYQFFIQIEIIFQIFKDKTDQIIETFANQNIDIHTNLSNHQQNNFSKQISSINIPQSANSFTAPTIDEQMKKSEKEEIAKNNSNEKISNHPTELLNTSKEQQTKPNIFKNPKLLSISQSLEKISSSPKIDTEKYMNKDDDDNDNEYINEEKNELNNEEQERSMIFKNSKIREIAQKLEKISTSPRIDTDKFMYKNDIDSDDLHFEEKIQNEEEEEEEEEDKNDDFHEELIPNYIQDFTNADNLDEEYIVNGVISDKKQLNYKTIKELKQILSVYKSTRQKINKDEKTKLRTDSLLKAINTIGSKGNFKFQTFQQLAENDTLPKFVMYFFNISKIRRVKLDSESESQKNKNIKAVLNYLSKKELKFKFLIVNYKKIPSIINFYQNFLNFFFTKKSRKQMFKRCAIILCTHDTLELSDLHNYNVYIGLLHFLVKGNVHFNFTYYKTDFNDETAETFFNKAKIPMIINSSLMKCEIKKVSDPFYYQLQFIFDALDYRHPSRLIPECLLKSIYKLKKITIPSFKDIIQSLNAKNVSLKYRKENSNIIQTNENPENEEKTAPIINKFNKRYLKSKFYLSLYKLSDDEEYLQQEENESNDIFLIDANSNFKYNNGILCENEESQNQSKEKWTDEMTKIEKNVSKSRRRSNAVDKKNSDYQTFVSLNRSKSSTESKLYKIFYYDEKTSSWKFHISVFNSFASEKMINVGSSKTPLVLFINSLENDVKTINSKFINCLYPNFDDENEEENDKQIFVYSFCDNNLSMLNYVIDFNSKEKTSIKPIFLSLHIPKNKENLPNLDIIITQIYSFLFAICDLSIVVLDMNYYLYQLEFLKTIQSINNSFQNSAEANKESSFIYKDSKIILLISDPTVKFNYKFDEAINTNNFFMNFKSQIKKECKMNYININDNETYQNFLTSLNDMLITNNTTFSEVRSNFQFIRYSNMNKFYIYLIKNFISYDEKLKEIIYDRFSKIKASEKKEKSSLSIFSKLSNEVLNIAPEFDKDLIQKIITILSNLKSDNISKNTDGIKSELKISADSHLSFIKYSLDQKYFWTKQQMDFFKKTHFRFLDEEFFSIIKLLNSDKKYNIYYEDNIEILENQIKEDSEKMNEMFKPFYEKIEIKNHSLANDFRVDMNKGTNYSMKETENLREIKVTVQINEDLKSQIEQDF